MVDVLAPTEAAAAVAQHPFNEAVPGAVLETTPAGLVVAPAKLLDLAYHLRDRQGYDYLSMVTSVDYPSYLEVV